jgi:hypothetical protein
MRMVGVKTHMGGVVAISSDGVRWSHVAEYMGPCVVRQFNQEQLFPYTRICGLWKWNITEKLHTDLLSFRQGYLVYGTFHFNTNMRGLSDWILSYF